MGLLRLRAAILAATLLFRLHCASVALCQSATTASTQAQVTFYSNEVTLLGGLPGHKPAAFKGRIFDADEQLVFMEPGHFITFNATPGTHVFSATPWTSLHANTKYGAHVTVELIAGEHYFVQTLILSNYVGSSRIFINEVTCEGAKQDAKNSRPLEPVHLRPAGVPLAVSESTFPNCP